MVVTRKEAWIGHLEGTECEFGSVVTVMGKKVSLSLVQSLRDHLELQLCLYLGTIWEALL